MLFNSIEFLLFFPVVVCLYFLIPQKWKWVWLLVSSYYFYMSWNPKYVVLIGLSTVITWVCGGLMGRLDRRKKKPRKISVGTLKRLYLLAGLVSNFAILFFFKYFGFFRATLLSLGSAWGLSLRLPSFDVLLPVGISFYTFQAVGYMIDVYRGEIEPEKNLFRYALFVSFFPQLVAGPIERSKNLLTQMHEPHFFDGKRVTDGLLLMGWGFFKKLVIADRIAGLVTVIYDGYVSFTGMEIAAATVLFAVQIYCDFSGYSDIAVGAAQVMGFRLMENFDRPYFAASVSEFWRRWHISLTTWFRDYVYIPLGGNRKGKLKKYRNVLITFGLSGLWHGADWSFVVWGLLNGLYQVVGDATAGLRQKLRDLLHIDGERSSYRVFRSVITFFLVDFAWLFFRADSFRSALDMLAHSVKRPGLLSLMDTRNVLGLNTLTLDEKDFCVMLLAILVLFVVDLLKTRIDLRAALARQNLVFRYLAYYALLLIILIFGVYGPEYNAAAFIYFQF